MKYSRLPPRPADRRNIHLAGPDRLLEGLVQKRRGAVHGFRRVVDPQSQGADGGAMRDVEGMGEALLVRIHDDVDVTLPPAGHRLRAMVAGLLKPEPAQGLLEPDGAALVHGELDELDAGADGFGRKNGRSGRAAPVRRRSSSSMTISERCPSMATLRAEPARKRSLKISRESRPSNPVARERDP